MMMTISVTGKHRRGFTLVELLIVVAIIGSVTVFAMPAIRDAAMDIALDEAGRRVYAVSGLLRDMASRDGEIYFLGVDRDNGEFVPSRKGMTGRVEALRFHAARPFKAGAGVAAGLEPVSAKGVYFYPDMSNDRSTLTLRGHKGRCISIEYSGMNGGINMR